MTAQKSFGCRAMVLALFVAASCSVPFGAKPAAHLQMVLEFPGGGRSVLTPETNRVEVTVTSSGWSAPKRFDFTRTVESTLTLTIPNVPAGTVSIDVVAGIGDTQLDTSVTGGHADATIGSAPTTVQLSLLPLSPKVQTTVFDPNQSAPTAEQLFDDGPTTLIQLSPESAGLYRLLSGPYGSEELSPAYFQVYDATGKAVTLPGVEFGEGLSTRYFRVEAGGTYYVAARSMPGAQNVVLFEPGAYADLAVVGNSNPSPDIDVGDTLVFTFPSAMDTGQIPTLEALDDQGMLIDGSSFSPTWISSTRLQVSSTVPWPAGQVTFFLLNLRGAGFTDLVDAGSSFEGELKEWRRTAWNTLYIDPLNGSDSNNGLSRTAPARSLNKFFASNLTPGNSLFTSGGIDEGTYGIRILLAYSPNTADAHNAVLPGTTYLIYDTDHSGINIQGGRDPSNGWERAPGKYTYVGFDGDITDVHADTFESDSLYFSVTSGASPMVLEGLSVERKDQSAGFTTPTAPVTASTYRLAKVKVTTASGSKVVIQDNLFDAGLLHYTASTQGAMFNALYVEAASAVIARNSIRNRNSTLTDSGAYASFIGLWVQSPGANGQPLIVANNTVETGGLTAAPGGIGGGYLGMRVTTNSQPAFVFNNTVMVSGGQSNQSGATREGIRGNHYGDTWTWNAANNLITFLDSEPLFFHQYFSSQGSSTDSFTSVRNNLFSSDSTLHPEFGGLSGSGTNAYLAPYTGAAYETVSDLNAVGAGYTGNVQYAWSEVATAQTFTDFINVLQPGGFVLQPGSISAVRGGAYDAEGLAYDFYDEEREAFLLDRLGRPHTAAGGWSMGAYEQD